MYSMKAIPVKSIWCVCVWGGGGGVTTYFFSVDRASVVWKSLSLTNVRFLSFISDH